VADGGASQRIREELTTTEAAIRALRLEVAHTEDTRRSAPKANRAWLQATLEQLDALLRQDVARARIEIARHLDGPMVVRPKAGSARERRVELSGRVKTGGLLGPQEAVVYAVSWLRGLDLNQRPLSHEGKSGHHSSQDEPSKTNDDRALANCVVGVFCVISVALLHSRFIGFDPTAALARTRGFARAS
jgi:hypothetical protein